MTNFATSDIHTKFAQVEAELTQTTYNLREKEEQMERDEQRMFFLLNADTAREDFYEIRSSKNGEVRHIIINSQAEIIFDSEKKVVTEGCNLPQFDEISEKFLRVIADDPTGRNYYRQLRGLHVVIKVPHGLPTAVRNEMKREQQEAANEEARQLRQVIVDNFRSQDCMERQGEIDEILCRKEQSDREQVELCACQASLQQELLQLQTQVAEQELKRVQDEAMQNEANRKRQHDSKRLAWLDRFNPSARSQPVPVRTDNDATSESAGRRHRSEQKETDAHSAGSTSCDECRGFGDLDNATWKLEWDSDSD